MHPSAPGAARAVHGNAVAGAMTPPAGVVLPERFDDLRRLCAPGVMRDAGVPSVDVVAAVGVHLPVPAARARVLP